MIMASLSLCLFCKNMLRNFSLSINKNNNNDVDREKTRAVNFITGLLLS